MSGHSHHQALTNPHLEGYLHLESDREVAHLRALKETPDNGQTEQGKEAETRIQAEKEKAPISRT